jgi:hypothetical protein
MRAWAEGKPQTGTGNNKGPGIVAPALPLLALIHPSSWNRFSRKSISKILHSLTPLPQETPASGTLHNPVPIPLLTPMDRYARSWMFFSQTNVCASE